MRFHFNQADGAEHPDEQGTELSSIESARREALMVLTQSVAEYPEAFWKEGFWRVNVTDDAGRLMFALELSAVQRADIDPQASRVAPGPE